MLQNRAYNKTTGFDSIVADAGAIAAQANSAAAPGVDTTITTTGVHGISQRQIDEGHKITITGTTAGQYDGLKVVTRIVSTTQFDIAHVFVSNTSNGAFIVEKIYVMSPGLLASLAVQKPVGEANIYSTLQEVKANDKHNTNIVWILIGSGAGDFIQGDSRTITGFKVSGNPSAEVKIVPTQMNSWS